MPLSDEDVREILRLIDGSDLDELRIETPGFALHVRRGAGAAVARPPGHSPATVAGARALRADELAAPAPAAVAIEAGPAIEAPMLGTFYRAESPSHAPFVSPGDRVQPETVVCLIEVMKLMNHIEAGVSGTIVEVLAANGTLVEFGQPLFRIQPDG